MALPNALTSRAPSLGGNRRTVLGPSVGGTSAFGTGLPSIDINRPPASSSMVMPGSMAAGRGTEDAPIGSVGDGALSAQDASVSPTDNLSAKMEQSGAAPTKQPKEKSDADKFYDDLLAQKDASWSNIEALQQANSAAMSRRVQAMQGAAGRAVAGGWMGNVAQAFLAGQQQLMGARAQFDQERSNLAMDIMGRKQAQANWQAGMDYDRERWETEQEMAANEALADSGATPGEIDILTDDDPSNDYLADQNRSNREQEQKVKDQIAAIQAQLDSLAGLDDDDSKHQRAVLMAQLAALTGQSGKFTITTDNSDNILD